MQRINILYGLVLVGLPFFPSNIILSLEPLKCSFNLISTAPFHLLGIIYY